MLSLSLPLAACSSDPDGLVLCRNLRDCFQDDFFEVYSSVAACEDDLKAEQADAEARYPECGVAQRALIACTASLGCSDLAGWLDDVEMAACEAQTQEVEIACNTPPDRRDGGVAPGDAGM